MVDPPANRFPLLVVLATLGLAALVAVHVAIGTVELTAGEVLDALRGQPADAFHGHIVVDLRLPRALIAVVAGAMLGLAGAVLQAITRNPLAAPGSTGVSAGGVLAAVSWLTFAPRPQDSAGLLPAAALVGGLAAGGLGYVLSASRGRTEPVRQALAGVLLSAVLQSATSLLLVRNQDALGNVLLWIVGSLNGRVWVHWTILWPWALVTLPVGLAGAGLANVLQLGDDLAAGLGLHVEWARAALLVIAVALTAGAVAVVGAIGFVGLIGPHLARRVVGNDARRSFPASALLSGGLLLGADVVAQSLTINPPFVAASLRAGLPVGAVTSLLGAPFLLFLLRRGTH